MKAYVADRKDWTNLFDGKTLTGWKPSDFAGQAEVTVDDGAIQLPMGNDITGITWTNPLPRVNYEILLDAMRDDGSDFFCGLTFPVKESSCSLILGGWGGTLVGLSSIGGRDASENETTSFISFKNKQWYHILLRVTDKKIQAWLDGIRIIEGAFGETPV